MKNAVSSFRHLAVLLHRWAGLTIAAFLIVSGLTGAVISWDHELDEVLNPHLTKVDSVGALQDPIDLAEKIEKENPQVQVTYFEFGAEPGHSLSYWVDPLTNPETGELYTPGFNQIFIDPVSGEELGRREWGAVWPITTENFVSFLYKFHYSLHIPEFWGTDHWGMWLLGVIALIWTLDCFTGFYLTLPSRRRVRIANNDDTADEGIMSERAMPERATFWERWSSAWKVRWKSSSHKLNFDLHRAFSLWTWALLFVIAFTAFSLNLYREVFYPVMSLVSDVSPTPFDTRVPSGPTNVVVSEFSFDEVVDKAAVLAEQRGWTETVGSLWYAREFGIFRVEFFSPEAGHGTGGVGHKAIYIDSTSGEYLGDWLPWKGTAADLFVQAQFPLHSGRILGLPGRILISLMGIVVAMLSITGVVIWWRKYKARALKQKNAIEDSLTDRYVLEDEPTAVQAMPEPSDGRF